MCMYMNVYSRDLSTSLYMCKNRCCCGLWVLWYVQIMMTKSYGSLRVRVKHLTTSNYSL